MTSEVLKRKKGQILNSSERQMILNLINYLKEKNSNRSISEVVREISKATGCSERTIYKIRKEGSNGVVERKKRIRKKENKNSRNVTYDSFVKSSIRKKVHNCLLQNITPTINSLLCLLNNDPEQPNFKRSTLYALLKEIGFVYVQKGKKSVLTEKAEVILSRQQYLKDIKRLRNENRWIVYTGETVISLTKKKISDLTDSSSVLQRKNLNTNCKPAETYQDSLSNAFCTSTINSALCSNMVDKHKPEQLHLLNTGDNIQMIHDNTVHVSSSFSNTTILNSDFTCNNLSSSSLACGINIDLAENIINAPTLIEDGLTLNTALSSAVHDIACNTEPIPIHTIITDETYLITGSSELKEQEQQTDDIPCDSSSGVSDVKSTRELRFSVMHAGCDDGFIQGAEHIFLYKKKSEETNCYEQWFIEKLLPKIPPNSVIVADNNAPYHKLKEDNIPDSSWKKQQIKNWLSSKNINIGDITQKKDMLSLVNDIRSSFSTKYKIDEIAKQRGIIIVSLPPYHYELNPLNMIWPQVKHYVQNNLKNFKIKKIKQLIKDGFYSISQSNWTNYIYEVRHIEDLLCTVDSMQESNQLVGADDIKDHSDINSEFLIKKL